MLLTLEVREQEFERYHKAKQDLADVTRGGKDWSSCSFIDITIRRDRLNLERHKLKKELGEKVLQQLEGEVNE